MRFSRLYLRHAVLAAWATCEAFLSVPTSRVDAHSQDHHGSPLSFIQSKVVCGACREQAAAEAAERRHAEAAAAAAARADAASAQVPPPQT